MTTRLTCVKIRQVDKVLQTQKVPPVKHRQHVSASLSTRLCCSLPRVSGVYECQRMEALQQMCLTLKNTERF